MVLNEENEEEEFEEVEPAEIARTVASRLSRTELVQLAIALDEDSEDEFYDTIQEETRKVAPEIFSDEPGDPNDALGEDDDDSEPDLTRED